MKSIKQLREKLNLSQREFGDAIGVGQTAISNYEMGIRTPDIDTAIKIRDLASLENIEISIETILKPTAEQAA